MMMTLQQQNNNVSPHSVNIILTYCRAQCLVTKYAEKVHASGERSRSLQDSI